MWFEGFAQVVYMEITNTLYTKIMNNMDEEDGAPFVLSKSRGSGVLLVPHCVEVRFKEHARLW